MNHIKYMIARGIQGENIKLNLNDYMETKFPLEYNMAVTISVSIGKMLNI